MDKPKQLSPMTTPFLEEIKKHSKITDKKFELLKNKKLMEFYLQLKSHLIDIIIQDAKRKPNDAN